MNKYKGYGKCKKCSITVQRGCHPCWKDFGVCPRCFDYQLKEESNYMSDESGMRKTFLVLDMVNHLGTLRQMEIDSGRKTWR